MQKKLLWVGLVVAMLSGVMLFTQADADPVATYDAEDIYKASESAVFYLRALRDDGTLRAVGTGVVIDAKGTAATAYHVVKEAGSLEAVFGNGKTVKGVKLLGYDELTDAAVLVLPDPKTAGIKGAAYVFLPVREAALAYGEHVFALGYPLKETVIITEGIVNNPTAKINGRSRILTSAQIVSGMSGGPLVDEQGRLSGIISGSLRTMDNIHLVVDMGDVRSLLKKTAAGK
jgi:serine protease Do